MNADESLIEKAMPELDWPKDTVAGLPDLPRGTPATFIEPSEPDQHAVLRAIDQQED